MLHIVFSINDSKAGAFFPPFFFHSEGMAKRAFSDSVNDVEHAIGRHPADYTLFRLGVFDDNSGKIVPQTPLSLGNGVEFIAVELGDDDLFPHVAVGVDLETGETIREKVDGKAT